MLALTPAVACIFFVIKMIIKNTFVASSEKINVLMPAVMPSSAAYWIKGLFIIGKSSVGMAFVVGKKRVPKPAIKNTALRSWRVTFRLK